MLEGLLVLVFVLALVGAVFGVVGLWRVTRREPGDFVARQTQTAASTVVCVICGTDVTRTGWCPYCNGTEPGPSPVRVSDGETCLICKGSGADPTQQAVRCPHPDCHDGRLVAKPVANVVAGDNCQHCGASKAVSGICPACGAPGDGVLVGNVPTEI